ncbi:MAG: hypothetical protein KAS02_00465 [Candidatus Pacebacteria bacterium]|nr:hypothetical protein [Candidatus Paceibacterota bacterium]
MRKQFVKTVENILENNKDVILLLGDIGIFNFRKSFKDFPDRVYNIGILEQSTIGMAAGLATCNLIPIVHTIAPFLIERSLEQLKLDFCYQKLGGNFVSVGASYDYAALGCSHHCPGDIGELMNLPEMEIIIPGTAKEFDILFNQSYDNGHPTYYRLSENSNNFDFPVKFGKAKIIKKGKKATIIAVGPLLDKVIEACKNLDVTILYYTTIYPFDKNTLKNNCESGKIFLCEPYYEGQLVAEIIKTLKPKPITIDFIGVPCKFLRKYGTAKEHDKSINLTIKNIETRIKKLIYG